MRLYTCTVEHRKGGTFKFRKSKMKSFQIIIIPLFIWLILFMLFVQVNNIAFLFGLFSLFLGQEVLARQRSLYQKLQMIIHFDINNTKSKNGQPISIETNVLAEVFLKKRIVNLDFFKNAQIVKEELLDTRI